MEAMEQTITVELTQSQYKHIKEVLSTDKPSKTRLTGTEKTYLKYVLDTWLNGVRDEEVPMIKNIIKKLK